MATKPRKKLSHHIDKKIRIRFRIYFILSIVMLTVVGYDLFKNIFSLEFAFVGILIGIGGGIISSRMNHLSWNHDAQKIVSRLDMFGTIILVAYIVFAIFRTKLILYFVHGPVVGAISFSIIAGIMIGRVLGTRGKILQILREERII